MRPQITFWIVFIILFLIFIFLDFKYNLFRDSSTARKQPYSFSRLQLSWWTLIILSSFITIILSRGDIPIFNESTLILLGMSSATSILGSIIDLADKKDNNTLRHQNDESQGLILDIISDQNGASIHRLQTVMFNFVFGIWMIFTVIINLINPFLNNISLIFPDIKDNNLVLIGLSSATYIALKIPENKAIQKTPPVL